MKIFWTTWAEGTNGGYGRQQPSFEEARKEAERLSRLPNNIGKPVRVLQCLGTGTGKDTTWEPTETDDIPF